MTLEDVKNEFDKAFEQLAGDNTKLVQALDELRTKIHDHLSSTQPTKPATGL